MAIGMETCCADVSVERHAAVAGEGPCHAGCSGEESDDDACEDAYDYTSHCSGCSFRPYALIEDLYEGESGRRVLHNGQFRCSA